MRKTPLMASTNPTARPSGPAAPTHPGRQTSLNLLKNILQVVNINEHIVNFRANIQVEAPSRQFFEVGIVNQRMLDEGSTIDYQGAQDGLFGLEITYDHNEPDEYFVAVRAPQDTAIVVTVNLEEIPGAAPPPSVFTGASSSALKYAVLVGVGVVCAGFLFQQMNGNAHVIGSGRGQVTATRHAGGGGQHKKKSRGPTMIDQLQRLT